MRAALSAIAGSVDANLIANRLQGWKHKADATCRLADEVSREPALRTELDSIGQSRSRRVVQERLPLLAGYRLARAAWRWGVMFMATSSRFTPRLRPNHSRSCVSSISTG